MPRRKPPRRKYQPLRIDYVQREIIGVTDFLRELRVHREYPEPWRSGMIRHYTARLKALRAELADLTREPEEAE